MPFPRPAALLALVLLAGCQSERARLLPYAEGGPEALARLAVVAEPGDERAVVLADGRGAFYYDALAATPSSEAMGFLVGGFRVVDGWRWWFPADSVGLGPADVTRGIARPDFAVRAYLEPDTTGALARFIRRFRGPPPKRITETVALADGALLVTVPDSLGTVELWPAFSDRPVAGYTAEDEGDVLLVARSNYLAPRGDSPRPVWLAVAATGSDGPGTVRLARVDLRERHRGEPDVRERSVSPGGVRFATPGAVAFATGMTPEEAAEAARAALARRPTFLAARQQRLAAVLARPTIRTEDEAFNRALDWARIQLEHLVVEDDAGFDLATGLPGAEAQPGWNTLQAFEGAFLVTGDWDRAADLLRRYAAAQRFDQRIDVFGRAPSRFVHGRPRYETADAQAVLVAALGAYLRTTGHDGLVLGERRLFWTNPVFAQRGMTDPRQLRTRDGFIRNEPGQTWLRPSTARRDVPPRAPVAVEVQARYLENLRTMEQLARIMGVRAQANAYADSARAFERRFARAFLLETPEGPLLADFLDRDGRPDRTLRPSPLFALAAVDLGAETERRLLRRLASELVFPHGVASRPQTDSLFYPYLEEPAFYTADEARYDGPVWTALAGPLISQLVAHGAPERAHEQFAHLQHLLLERGVVGAIAENLDAHPRARPDGGWTPPAPGGAPLQPFTLAEFVRTAYQDLLGVRYLAGHDVVLEPHLPPSWGTTTATFRVGHGHVRATLRQRGGELAVSVVPEGALPRGAQLRVRAFGKEHRLVLVRPVEGGVAPADSVALVFTANGIARGGETVAPDTTYRVPDPAFWDGFAWAEPEPSRSYAVLERVAEARRLTADQVTRSNPLAIPLIARTDPFGDDWGATATYTYPTSFPPGVLDAVYLEVAEDDEAFYFRIEMAEMVPPSVLGFHPAMFAIAISTEEGGQTLVGRGANYRLSPANAYNYIVFVGNGLRVEDHRGRVLGEFAQLGEEVLFPEERTLRFSLPKFVLPAMPRGATVVLLVGANDGSSPGRFRPVLAEASSQFGGGKINPNDPNVYDVISARVEGR